MPSTDTAPPDTRLSWRNVPGEILALILKPLVSRPRESYIPLICTHVCGHWRRVVSGTPLLWSYVDVSRGDILTKLWLVNSAQVKIDVRLWEHPSVSYGLSRLHPPAPRHPLALSLIYQSVERWRSLDIAYACLCRTVDAIKSLQPHSAPQLDYLTIGPMGKTAMHTDRRLSDPDLSEAMFLSDTTFRPLVVRIDTFTVCSTSPIFSARLLELEVFSKSGLEMEMWYSILSRCPNLTSLKLWHASSVEDYITPLVADTRPALPLARLKYLSLSGIFTSLATLFSQSSTPFHAPSLPALTSLRLSSTTPKVVPLYVGYLSAVAPLLSDLSVSFPRQRRRVESWKRALPNLRSLDRLTFFEMDVIIVFCLLKAELHDLPKPLSYLALERMSVPSDSDWSFLEVNGHRTKLIIRDLPGSEHVQNEKWKGKGIEYDLDNAIIRATESTGSGSDSSSDELETDTDGEEEDEYGNHTPSESSEDQEDEQEQDASEPGGEERVPKRKRDNGGDDDEDSWSLASGDLEVINQPAYTLESESETDSDSAFTSDFDEW